MAAMDGSGGKGTKHHVRGLLEKLDLTAEEEDVAAFSDEEDIEFGSDRKGSIAGDAAHQHHHEGDEADLG